MSECGCNTGIKLIYSCSGAADVGEISDRAARKLRGEGYAKGSCIAGVGANLPGYVQSAKGAEVNIVIDGCPVACARKILENIGINPVSYVVTDMGFNKGSADVTLEAVETVCKFIKNGPVQLNRNSGSGGCGCGCK